MSDQEKNELLKELDIALDDIRPHLQVDGGNIEVVDVTEDLTVMVKWLGNCQTCSMSLMTMRAGVEQAIKMRLPQIESIEAINGVA